MSRLYKKCIFASGGLHALLALILVTCPAFLTPKARPSPVSPITFIPDILIDKIFDNPGGSPGSRPPAPAPAPTPTPPAPVVRPAPTPPPQPPRVEVPEVVPQTTDVPSLEVSKKPVKKKPEISLTPVVRPSTTKSPAKAPAKEISAEDTREQQWLENRARAANAIGRAANGVKSGTSSATKFDTGYGSGNSSPSYASYEAWVLKVFDDAWMAPEDATSEDATVKVSVTIARDGEVIAKRIIQRSGDPAVDASVQRTLDHVTTMGRPFPEGAKDKQRSYTIPFNMKTRRGAA